MEIVYEDAATGLAVRRLDLDDKHDIQLFIQANKNIISQFRAHSANARRDPFYRLEMLVYAEIGHGMRINHLFEKERGYAIIQNGKEVGTGWVSELTWPQYYYPVVNGYELATPWTILSAKMHLAMARMMKTQGYSQVYSQILKGHPINTYIPRKRVIGEFPFGVPTRKPVLEFWELDVP